MKNPSSRRVRTEGFCATKRRAPGWSSRAARFLFCRSGARRRKPKPPAALSEGEIKERMEWRSSRIAKAPCPLLQERLLLWYVRLDYTNLGAPISYHSRGSVSSLLLEKFCASPFRPIGRAGPRCICALYQAFLFVTGLQVLPLDFSYFHGMIYKAGTGGAQTACSRQTAHALSEGAVRWSVPFLLFKIVSLI